MITKQVSKVDPDSRVKNLFKNVNAAIASEVKLYISQLSPTKKEIGELLANGYSYQNVLTAVARKRKTTSKGIPTLKSIITMVVDELEMVIKNNSTLQQTNTQRVEIPEKVTKQLDFNKGIRKQSVRENVLYKILESYKKFKIVDGLILTLSSWQCLMEKKINKEFPNFTFLTCENDKETLKNLFEERTKHNLKFIKYVFAGEIGKIIDLSEKDKFAHLLLDYCGTLNSYKDDIKLAIQKDILKKGGIIMVTLSTRVSIKGYNTLSELNKLIQTVGRGKYSIIHKESYKDTMDMITVIIRRTK